MIERKTLNENDIKKAMDIGEFPGHIINSKKNVAVIMTQDWCSQWTFMNRYLYRLVENDSGLECDIYEIIYNREPWSREFMDFKENTLGNHQIPYVRFYKDGTYAGEANYLYEEDFIKRLQ